MSKFFRKSLIIAVSSLCAINSCVDATYEADGKMDRVAASEQAKELRDSLKTQIHKYSKGEREYIVNHKTGTFAKWKDIIVNICVGVGITTGCGDIGAAMTKNYLGGALGGLLIGGLIAIPTTIRNTRRILEEEENLKNEYAMATLQDAKSAAKTTHVMDKAKENGNMTIL